MHLGRRDFGYDTLDIVGLKAEDPPVTRQGYTHLSDHHLRMKHLECQASFQEKVYEGLCRMRRNSYKLT